MIITGCEAPHSNPLDPENPGNNFSVIEGTVQTETLPRQPIPNVEVTWNPQEITVRSQIDGSFSLYNIIRNNGWLVFSKEGFLMDSVFVEFPDKNLVTVTKYLNSIPKIDELIIYSTVQNNFSTEPTYRLTVQVRINDEEDDVDTVFVENSELKLSAKLLEQTRSFYSKSFSLSDLKLSGLDQIIGKELAIFVKDKFNNRFKIGSSNLKRIIKEEVITLSPKNNEDSVSVTPELNWRRFEPGFNFHYRVQVKTNEVSPMLVWEKDQIPKDAISITVDQPLTGNPLGEYFWVIWAIDEFNNISISRPATFKIIL